MHFSFTAYFEMEIILHRQKAPAIPDTGLTLPISLPVIGPISKSKTSSLILNTSLAMFLSHLNFRPCFSRSSFIQKDAKQVFQLALCFLTLRALIFKK